VDGQRFDDVLRRAVGDGSRRGLLRAGVGALAASALGLVGLGASEDAAAKKKKKKTQPQTCAADRPIACGDGCCTTAYPQCCDDAQATSGKVCAPGNATCCPLAQGGGFCLPGQLCCPPTPMTPFGACCLGGNACCVTTANCPMGSICVGSCCSALLPPPI
jgi:hypothetical protein